MAAALWRSDPALSIRPLGETLAAHPYRFGFFQAVRLLQLFSPGRPPLGSQLASGEQLIRFRARVSLAFPASEIHDLGTNPERQEEDCAPAATCPEMTVSFMGLTGPQGVLPRFYTELLLQRLPAGDLALRDFLDLLNHRLISLFYRAWEKPRLALHFERARRAQAETDALTRYLLCQIGLGTPGLQKRLQLSDDSLLLGAGLLACRVRSASALAALIATVFALETPRGPLVRIEQFIPERLVLAAEEQTALGRRNHVLGGSVLIGDVVTVADARFRVVLGPLPRRRYLQFLPASAPGPGGRPLRQLTQLIRLFCGPAGSFEICLLGESPEHVGAELGALDTQAPQLGVSAWLHGHSPHETMTACTLHSEQLEQSQAPTGENDEPFAPQVPVGQT